MTKIAVFVGSLRADSTNKKLAKNLEALAPDGVEFNYVDLNLPLFNEELEADIPAEAKQAKTSVEEADGVLFVTPEYNRSMSGVLKNALDWLSRPYGENSLAGKPAGVVGASGGPLGTAVAQSELRQVLVYLGTKLLGQPEIYIISSYKQFDDQGRIDESLRDDIKNYIETFTSHVKSSQ